MEAAEPLRACAGSCLYEVHVKPWQRDVLSAVLRDGKGDERSAAAVIERRERSPDWVWTGMDPESTPLLAIDVGDRPLAMAQRVVPQVAPGLAPDGAPLFVTDGGRESLTALLPHYSQWVQPPCHQAQGPRPRPRWMPLPQRLSAPVVKTTRRRRWGAGQHRVVFGPLAAVNEGQSPLGGQSNTACIARLTLDIRQRVAAGGRRGNTLCQGEEGLRQPLVVCHADHTLVVPQAR